MGKTKKYDHMGVIYRYAGAHRHLIAAGRVLAALSAVLTLLPYYDLWRILKVAAEGEELTRIRPLALQAVLLIVAALLVYIAALFCTHIAAFRVQANMRSALLRRILTLPLGVFDDAGTGRIRRTVNDSTAATETYIAHNLPDQTVAAVTPIGLLVLVLASDWRIGLICMIPAVIGFACMMTMMGKNMQEKLGEYQNALDAMSSEATEYVRGIPVVKTFGQTVYSFSRFKSLIDAFGKWATDYTLTLRLPMVAFMTCINSIFIFLVIAAYAFAGQGSYTAHILNIMYYILMTPLITVALTKIAYSGEAEMTLIDGLKRVEYVLGLEPLPERDAGKRPADASVELREVCYRYPGAARDAVNGVSLRIAAGEHIALVGSSGSGKTTAAELIARFFDVTEGAVLVGGVDVREMPQRELMERISFVFQDSRLLKTSILENVRLSREDATREEVLAALQKAQCMDIIEKLPAGIDTVIGEKGVYLSGGEQQRITIARAMLKDAPILILDEATAFADPDNEARVQAAFDELSKDKTLIMIAHRLSTVVHADRIYVMEDGRITESGTHGELMERGGLYRRMYDGYMRSIEWKVGA